MSSDLNTNINKSFLQFSNPVLKESIFIKNVNYSDSTSKKKQFDLSIKTTATKPEIENDNYYSIVSVIVTNMPNDLNTDTKHPFFLNVNMQARFFWKSKENLSENTVKTLLSINAPALVLGYIRPYITNLTSQTEFPTQYIPFINFTKNHK